MTQTLQLILKRLSHFERQSKRGTALLLLGDRPRLLFVMKD
jgi:hypothetical protein